MKHWQQLNLNGASPTAAHTQLAQFILAAFHHSVTYYGDISL